MSDPVEVARSIHKYFGRTSVWPLAAEMDLEGWLSNFSGDDVQLAARLVGELVHYSERHCHALLLDSIRRISSLLVGPEVPATDLRNRWATFVQRAYFVPVADAHRGAESGPLMALWSRKLGVNDRMILPTEVALDRLHAVPDSPIVFIDDLVLTGDKVDGFLKRPFRVGKEEVLTFAQEVESRGGEAVLCCMLASGEAIARINADFPRLLISTANILDAKMALSHPQSSLFPEADLPVIRDFVVRSSAMANIPPSSTFGHGKKGYLLSMHNNVPDSTLPIIWWEKDGWRPLLRRS